MSRLAMTHRMPPAGGIPLVALMLAVTVFSLGTASQLIRQADQPVPSVEATALPSAIEGLGELPLPPR